MISPTTRARAPLVGLAISLSAASASAQAVTPRIEAVFPHDSMAFTQGLELFEGRFFESTGLTGRSTLRRVTVTTGAVEKSVALDSSLFGEGLARIDRQLIQLTYTTGVAIVYDLDTLAELKRFTYTGEGWGLCYDGTDLLMTNGSDKLVFRDPTTFAVRREVTVRLNGAAVDRLNELECVGSLVYMNEWQTDNILRVDKATGNVLTLIDASALLTADEKRNANVLNGIAYDESKRHFYLTGKYWPKLFEVSFDFEPGGSADGGVDAGSGDGGERDAGPVSDAGDGFDTSAPRDANRDAAFEDRATVDVGGGRDAASPRDGTGTGGPDRTPTDAGRPDTAVPPSDASASPDGGGGQGGAGGNGGGGAIGGSAGSAEGGAANGCACRAVRGAGGAARAITLLIGAFGIAALRRVARRLAPARCAARLPPRSRRRST